MLISNMSSLQDRKSMVNYSEVLQYSSCEVRYLNKGGKTGNRSNRTVPYHIWLKPWFSYRLLPVVTILVPTQFFPASPSFGTRMKSLPSLIDVDVVHQENLQIKIMYNFEKEPTYMLNL